MGKYLDMLRTQQPSDADGNNEENSVRVENSSPTLNEKYEIYEKCSDATEQNSYNSYFSYSSEGKTTPALPWQLERLVNAASSGALLSSLRGVPDTTRYVLAWSAAYLVGDKAEALKRLWEVYEQWQQTTN